MNFPMSHVVSARSFFDISFALIVFCSCAIYSWPQNAVRGQSSLRGTAKVDGTLVVDGVRVVLTQRGQDGRPVGQPVPALVSNTGDYRIQGIEPGKYVIRAIGSLIVDKTVPDVVVLPGHSNVVDLKLERAVKQTNVHGKVFDFSGQPLRNARVAIYSPSLPPSICIECYLEAVISNENGEILYVDIAAQRGYNFAIMSMPENRRLKLSAGKTSNKTSATSGIVGAINGSENRNSIALMIATETINVLEGAETLIELRINGGSERVLTATLMPPAPTISPMQVVPDNFANNRLEQVTLPPNLANSTAVVSTASSTSNQRVRTMANDQRAKVQGVVTRRDEDTFIVRDAKGEDTVVLLTDRTSVKSNGAFLRSGTNYATTNILRGLNVEVEGRGDSSGQLRAEKVRFNESDLLVARTVESRVDPVESRVGDAENRIEKAEQGGQRLAGQIDELAAVSNAAGGGAKAAQMTADQAVAGSIATNERISALDDYSVRDVKDIYFRVNSAVLSTLAKQQLDELANQAMSTTGCIIEISGYADATGNYSKTRVLSQRRADAVIQYLKEVHAIPLRRIVTPFRYSAAQTVADNYSRAGLSQNRRVEVKILVNSGLSQPSPSTSVP